MIPKNEEFLNILGLNYHHPDSSACLIKDGLLSSAVDEERFTRIKHFSGFPLNAIDYCLSNDNLKISDLDYIALNFNPNSNLSGKLIYVLKNFFRKTTINKILNLKKKIKYNNDLKLFLSKNNFNGKIINVDHHKSHLASSYFLSDFKSCLGLTIDGFGDFSSMESFECRDKNIKSINKVLFPHSLGIFYQATTQYLGFKKYGDEYKLMGLASYGKPVYLKEFSDILKFDKKNYFRLNLKYFKHHTDKNFKYSFGDGVPKFNDLFSDHFVKIFGKPRQIDGEIEQKHMDIASSMQKHFEDVIIKILNNLYDSKKNENLCLAGGCAFNSKLNGLIKEKTNFKNIFIQPNAGDGGGSVGAAFYLNSIYGHKFENKNKVYLGPKFSNEEVEKAIKERKDLDGFKIDKVSDDEIYFNTALKLSNNLIIGWFKGRMEWGPRALGNRSILANPKNKNIKDILNLKIKLRERFRPFAPAVLYDQKEKYFDIDYHSPFMLNVVDAKTTAINDIPAVVHVDNTCRVQTVKKEENLHFFNLITKFKEITGVPILLNTSFNENEPIVLNPQEAIDCFVRTKMDFLVMENWTISR